MNERSKIVRDGYDVIAHSYHERRVAREHANIEWLDGLAAFLPGSGRVVDLGCGSGVPITRYFADRGYDVVGYDISDEMLAIARKEVPWATFYTSTIEDLTLSPSSIDIVVSIFAIIHVDRQFHESLFKSVFGWLRQGGAVLLSLGAEDNPDERQDDWHGAPMVWSHFGARANLDLLGRAGFDILWNEVEDLGGEKHLFVIGSKP
jgi:SAM-dependent methyltransferase